MQDKDITLKLRLINIILSYLGTRPYNEVFQIVHELQAQAASQIKPAEPANSAD